MENKKGIKILSARNGIALISVLAILLILTLFIPVMFSMSEIQMKDAVKGTTRQKAYYLSRTGAELGIGAVKTMVSNVYSLEVPEKPENEKNTNWMTATQQSDADKKYDKDLAEYNSNINKLKKEHPEEFSSYELYNKLKTATSAGNGIFIDKKGRAGIKCDRLWFYIKTDDEGNEESVYEFVDAAETNAEGPHQGEKGYTYVGYCDVTVSYDGNAKTYKIGSDGKPKEVSEEAYEEKTVPFQAIRKRSDKTIVKATLDSGHFDDDDYEHISGSYKVKEVREDYYTVQTSAFYVTAESKVGSFKTTKKAVLVEPATSKTQGGSNNRKFVEYTGTSWKTSPDFVKSMCGYSKDYLPVETKENIFGNDDYHYAVEDTTFNLGGNQCFANPYMANYKTRIKYEEITNSIANPYVYVYTTIGNMVIDVDNCKSEYVLGTYPGINWSTDNNWNTDFDAVNYHKYSDEIQNYNFCSFCASESLECKLPIDVRVNPSRCGRTGDLDLKVKFSFIPLQDDSNNADLFKMITFQAKDIVFDGGMKLFFSFNQDKSTGAPSHYVIGRRFGTVVLSAPENTPYTYYHKDYKKTVKAGKVYFKDDVYIWVIKWGKTGETRDTETYYDRDGTYWIKEKIFNAGDVYYFNSDIIAKNKTTNQDENVGISLVNYWLETNYLQRSSLSDADSVRGFFKTLRKNLFVRLVDTFAQTDTYKKDDMHYIGNINTDKGLEAPEVEDVPYIVWDE